MKKMLLAVALVAALLPLSAMAQNAKVSKSAIGPIAGAKPSLSFCVPSCVFYGGDWDPTASNWVAFGNGDEYDAGTVYNYTNYVPFVVPSGATWTVVGLFTNNIFYNYVTLKDSFMLNPPDASWSISTGLSTGNGGTLLYGGTLAPAKPTSTGRSYSSIYYEYAVSVKTGKISLPSGTYWLAVAPECTASSCEQFMYNTDSTSRTNHIGYEPTCQSYQNSPNGGLNYQDDCNAGYSKAGSAVMSAGVLGKP